MPYQLAGSWKNSTYISFDTETSGAYPLEAEICEVAAVKWENGAVVGEFQSLVRVSKPMSTFIIGIHGITNEMVAEAPPMSEVVRKFHAFIQDSVLCAHHAPFDLGFLALEMEKLNLRLPDPPVICTSLLSRKVFPDFPNHKLQTLIPLLGLDQGTAHRALDDSKACLQLAIKCMEKVGAEATLQDVLNAQVTKLNWSNYSMNELRNHNLIGIIVHAIETGRMIELGYKGTSADHKRPVKPLGIVRNPDGDYLVGYCEREQKNKRYYLHRIQHASQLLV
ncbi:MAG: exonuclease domain-containing protein [Bdellovibrionia bacterium]